MSEIEDIENIEDPMASFEKAKKMSEDIRSTAKKMMPKETLAAAEKFKAQGLEVYACIIGDQWFIYRPLNRFEYQNLLLDQAKESAQMASQADSEMAATIMTRIREQNATVIKATLYPHIDLMSVKALSAGVVDSLYNNIMLACGFGQEPMPIKL